MSDVTNTLKAIERDLELPLRPNGKLMTAIREEVDKALSATDAEDSTRTEHLTAINAAVATRYATFNVRTKQPGKLPAYVASGNVTALNQALTAVVFDAAVASLEMELAEEE